MGKDSQLPNLASLSQTLMQKEDQDRRQVEALATHVLQKLETSLMQQSGAVLTITGAAMQQQTNQMQSDVAAKLTQAQQELSLQIQQMHGVMKTIGKQKETLAAEVSRTEKLLRWLRRIWWASLTVCLLGFVGIWAYWKLLPPWEMITAQDGKEWQVMKGSNWQMCQGNRPCRLYGTN